MVRHISHRLISNHAQKFDNIFGIFSDAGVLIHTFLKANERCSFIQSLIISY
jgi:hypothetical protein